GHKGGVMARRFLRAIPLLVLCIVARSAWMPAQSFTASIRGVVMDTSQAGVPNAQVVATDVNRNRQYPAVTDSEGRYVITTLPPGTYALTVEAKGFNTYSRNAFDLQVQQQATIDVTLTLGAVETVLDVQAQAPLLNLTSAALGQVIENKFILSLPLIG